MGWGVADVPEISNKSLVPKILNSRGRNLMCDPIAALGKLFSASPAVFFGEIGSCVGAWERRLFLPTEVSGVYGRKSKPFGDLLKRGRLLQKKKGFLMVNGRGVMAGCLWQPSSSWSGSVARWGVGL